MNMQLGSDIEHPGRLLQQLTVDASVDQRAEEHVSADAGEAFEVSDTHSFLFFQMNFPAQFFPYQFFPDRRRTSTGSTSFIDPER